jgi:plastocyanin
MSIWGHKVSAKLIAIVVAVVVVGALVAAVSRTPAREITLVAKGMAFYLESDLTTPNPTIVVKAGERVRIVLRNEDRGFVHDFAVPTVDAAVDQVNWNEAAAETIEMPDRPGAYEYICRPHRLMMNGTILVQ